MGFSSSDKGDPGVLSLEKQLNHVCVWSFFINLTVFNIIICIIHILFLSLSNLKLCHSHLQVLTKYSASISA